MAGAASATGTEADGRFGKQGLSQLM
jgi:hypothetical protein